MNLKSFRNPDLYHGRMGKLYFEGWYIKLVDARMKNTLTFIPGIFFSPDPEYSHAFIQVIDGTAGTYNYEKYQPSDFWADRDEFAVKVGGSSFGSKGVFLSIDRPGAVVSGNVQFSGHLRWPDSLLNPGSMGFYNYILKMQCYSQVCYMDFDLEGHINFNGSDIDLTGGRGYIEKNWGASFPYSWVWVQCNHFPSTRASLSCSLGHIPLLGTRFRGTLVGLYVENSFYAFTTMNRSKTRVTANGTDLTLYLENKDHNLTVDCETNKEDFILLNGPRGDQMIPLVQENLQGQVHVTLKENRSGKTLFADTGYCAGVEYGGEQMLVLDEKDAR